MKASFPTLINANFLGKSRDKGEFKDDDGVEVRYGEKFDFTYENSEGLSQTVAITDKRLREAGCDPDKLKRLQAVHIEGDVVVSDKGGYLKPTKVTATAAS